VPSVIGEQYILQSEAFSITVQFSIIQNYNIIGGNMPCKVMDNVVHVEHCRSCSVFNFVNLKKGTGHSASITDLCIQAFVTKKYF
jgi:hypothetical protein